MNSNPNRAWEEPNRAEALPLMRTMRPRRAKSAWLGELACLGLLVMCLCLCGCQTSQRALNQFYAAPLSPPQNIEALAAKYTNWVAIAAQVQTNSDPKAARNAVLSDLFRLSDHKYESFKAKLYVADAGYNSLMDLTSIGLSAAATLVGGGAAQALSATDTGLKAAQGKLAERWLNTKAMRILLLSMDGARAEIRSTLYEGMNKPYAGFSIEEGFQLINRYHACASVPNALTYLEATMGEKKQVAEEEAAMKRQ